MLYEILCLVIAALGAYGINTAHSRLFRRLWGDSELSFARGLRVCPGFSYEELEDALFLMQAELENGEEPVLLVDCPLRSEVLSELRALGVELYLSYEEYYNEKGK